MPEMPEIETLARKLRKAIVGKQIADVYLSGCSLRKPVTDAFAANLRGRTVRRIVRRGKYIVAELEPKAFWLIHMGMSGSLLYQAPADQDAKHIHATVHFSDGTQLRYRDPRRFGLLAAYDLQCLDRIPEIRSLGIDPLSPAFNTKSLGALLKKSRREIKSFLLDQHKIVGLGNIYACEGLFLARLHPGRRCFTLTALETRRLVRAIRVVIRSAIRHRGTSFSDFMDIEGKPGENQDHLMVFLREGEKCRCCSSPIRRIRQGNRSTFYCPACQR